MEWLPITVLLSVASAGTISALREMKQQNQLRTTGMKTRAIVVKPQGYYFGNLTEVECRLPDKTLIKASKQLALKCRQGEQVEIVYNPANPAKFQLAHETSTGLFSISLVVQIALWWMIALTGIMMLLT